MEQSTDEMTRKWWGYEHQSGSLQVKRYFSSLDVEEAIESPFCKKVRGPFLAMDRDDAVRQLKELLE